MDNGYSITRDKFLSPDEVRQLLKVCEEKAIVDTAKGRKTWVTRAFLIHFALYTGLRVSEIADLCIGDLYLTGISDSYLVVRKGKGNKKRSVYIDAQTKKYIKKYLDYKKKVEFLSMDANAPVLAKSNGEKYTTTALYLSFKQAIKAANLPSHYSIHSARHTYATLLLNKTGGNLRFVQRQLGHASLNMTTLYADILPEQNQNLANSIIK